MASVSSVIEDARSHLLSMHRPELNQLSLGRTAADTSIVFLHDLPGLAKASFLSVDDELMYVLTYDAPNKTATVLRAQGGSLAAVHAVGAIVEINPAFPRYKIKQALKQDIASWPEHLFQVRSVTYSLANGQRSIALTEFEDYLHILNVSHSITPSVGADRWVTFEGWSVTRGLGSDDAQGGVALTLPTDFGSTVRIRVMASVPFALDEFVDETDLEGDVGLAASMTDIPPLGAAARLLMSRESRRLFVEGQSEPRHADEVRPGQAIQTARNLLALRDRRISDEVARLRGLFPFGGA